MKRFLIFAGSLYYPSGGWHDFEFMCETIEEAQGYINGRTKVDELSWAHAYDTETKAIVLKAGKQP